MNSANLITVTDLYRYYVNIPAVQGISFDLRRGEVLGFLGPNGAGKSTTMQIIAGTLAPSAGQVLICGIDLVDEPRAAKAELGYLPEQPPLYRELTVDEYLRYCARLHGVARNRVGKALANAKERCGLGESGKRLIGNLSKGFQQRVGIAQAILHGPSVVILDEPTVGLDPIQIREIRALIRELGKDHGIILSTHILPEVQMVCDRVQILHEGRLVLDETVERLGRGLEECALRIGWHRPPPPESLATLPGVDKVEPLADGRLRLHYLKGADPTEGLVQESVRQGWGLFELTPERRSLEEVFIALTCGEESAREQTLPLRQKTASPTQA